MNDEALKYLGGLAMMKLAGEITYDEFNDHAEEFCKEAGLWPGAFNVLKGAGKQLGNLVTGKSSAKDVFNAAKNFGGQQLGKAKGAVSNYADTVTGKNLAVAKNRAATNLTTRQAQLDAGKISQGKFDNSIARANRYVNDQRLAQNRALLGTGIGIGGLGYLLGSSSGGQAAYNPYAGAGMYPQAYRQY